MNAYDAFQVRDEEASYQALAMAAEGEFLEKLYLQIRKGLLDEEQGGAVGRVKMVIPQNGQLVQDPASSSKSIAPNDERAFQLRLAWTVEGDVVHWGHIHSRKNGYEAILTVEPLEQGWRFTDMQMLDDRRIESRVKLRGL